MNNNLQCDEKENIEINKPNEVVKEKTMIEKLWTSKTKFEKSFWITILCMFILYFSAVILANLKPVQRFSKDTVLEPYLEKLLETDIVKNNLDEHQGEINKSLNLQLDGLYDDTDIIIDKLYVDVENNVDTFLDFHYSVIGEYLELGAAVNDGIRGGDYLQSLLEDKIIPEDFSGNYSNAMARIDDVFQSRVKKHREEIEKIAFIGVDYDIDNKALDILHSDINERIALNSSKTVAFIAGRVGLKGTTKFATSILTKPFVKITSRLALKIPTKAATKFGIKKLVKVGVSLTAGGAATLACGPCGVVVAAVTWFILDWLFVSGDEYINREELKIEILKAVEESKLNLKSTIKGSYHDAFEKLSDEMTDEYRRKRLIDRI
ncbi:MAG: hypothetical protein OEW87_15105 [Flavobacteriaceae bacterium]|nr:hypothetical protein [Flavobacteriaceae bacterium]